jgi:hypothetical protein
MVGRRSVESFRQLELMRRYFPHFRYVLSKDCGRLTCRGDLQPTSLARSYRVRLEYRVGLKPRVFVEEPRLQRRLSEESIPHTYSENEPCLFKDDWTADLALATSVVPWLMLWLQFYESWRVTGVWQGGGIAHGPGGEV